MLKHRQKGPLTPLIFTEAVIELQDPLVEPLTLISPVPVPTFNHTAASPILPPITRSPSQSVVLKETQMFLKKSQEMLNGLSIFPLIWATVKHGHD